MELFINGPVGYREFKLAKTCNVSENHRHNYDHVTIVIMGTVSITINGIEGNKEYGPGAVINVPATQEHTIKALTDNVRYLCVFSHRDFNGLVTQDYLGDHEAYA